MNLITGATGLLGSHIAEQLRAQGQPVRALVRPGSDVTFLKSIGAELAEGDITDPASLPAAFAGVEVVYHSAAKVGDWGPWEDFERITVGGTRNMIAAAAATPTLQRFVHISSISAYGYYTREGQIDESYDLGYKLYRWAYYSRSKIIAEQLAWEAHRAGRIPLTVIRPAWIYGPRDRATIARLYRMIKTGRAKILGRGDNRLNVVYAGNVADASILAAHHPDALGEAFNCSNDGPITQQEYFDLMARTIGAPPVQRHVPYRIAYNAGFLLECLGHLFHWQKPPFVTRYAVWLMGRRSYFSAEKARRVLGWQPAVSYDEGVPRTIRWYEQETGAPAANPA
jgi:nucleoside-diphosphate-sugar epimerase